MIRDFTPELQRAIDELRREMRSGELVDVSDAWQSLLRELERFREKLKRQ